MGPQAAIKTTLRRNPWKRGGAGGTNRSNQRATRGETWGKYGVKRRGIGVKVEEGRLPFNCSGRPGGRFGRAKR